MLGAERRAVAVPSGSILGCAGRVTGPKARIAVDATNAFTGRDERYESLAHEVQGANERPVAKAFNANAGVLFDRVGDQRSAGCLYAARRRGARHHASSWIRDAGYEPEIWVGSESARALEDFRSQLCSSSSRRPFTGCRSPGEPSPSWVTATSW